jgi:hypothetical protein
VPEYLSKCFHFTSPNWKELFITFLGGTDLGFALLLAKQALYHLSHNFIPFFSDYFGDGLSRTICPGWLQTMILLISASQVARITGVSHCTL